MDVLTQTTVPNILSPYSDLKVVKNRLWTNACGIFYSRFALQYNNKSLELTQVLPCLSTESLSF